MKKEDFLSILVYLVMLVIALFIGLQIIEPSLEKLDLVSNVERYGLAMSLAPLLVDIALSVSIFLVLLTIKQKPDGNSAYGVLKD